MRSWLNQGLRFQRPFGKMSRKSENEASSIHSPGLPPCLPFSLLHIPSVFHDRVASVVPGSSSLMAVRLSFFLSLKLGATVLGGLPPGSGALVSLGACQVTSSARVSWLTLEEARGNSVSLRPRMCREPLGGSPGQLSAISGLRFAVPPVGLDVTWLSQVLQSCELRNVRAEQAFLPWAGWCL